MCSSSSCVVSRDEARTSSVGWLILSLFLSYPLAKLHCSSLAEKQSKTLLLQNLSLAVKITLKNFLLAMYF